MTPIFAIPLLGAALGLALQATPALADESADAARAEMESTLGQVPAMFSAFPDAAVVGAWQEFKTLQLNPDTELDGKTKELIGLAVAAQIPCHYCVYFHTAAAKANGATEEEVKEAVAMAAMTRHWSTVLNGMQTDTATFEQQVDSILEHASDTAAASN